MGHAPLPRDGRDDAAGRARRRPRARRRAARGASATRRFRTTSRCGGSCSRSASASTCGRTSGPRGCSRACPRPLAGGDAVDMLFVRENTEGEYSGVGGRAHQGLPHEVGIETAVFTRARRRARRPTRVRARGDAPRRRHERDEVERLALRLRALGRGRGARLRPSIPDVRYERVLVDALAARMVRNPLEPRRRRRLEPLRRRAHRHRRRAAGRDGHGGEREPRARLRHARRLRARARLRARHRRPGHREPLRRDLERVADARPPRRAGGGEPAARRARAVCREGIRTRDLGGTASTSEVGDAVASRV